MIGIWSLSIIVSFFWNDHQVRSLTMDQAYSELRTSFFKDLRFRQWATKHGGVYVPVTEDTQPDPYIAYIPERDVTTPSGRVLTLINPALMVRKFNEMAKDSNETQGHISSLNPINPSNKPDPWEARALEAFETGTKEISGISDIDGNPYLRLIRVLTMGGKCLVCHQEQGYKKDDVAGGVSVSVPLLKLEQTSDKKVIQIGIGHSILWLLGITGIWFGGRKLKQGIEENSLAYIALGENEARIRSILDTSLDAIITIDSMDIITDWNQQAEIFFGWSADEAIGKSKQHIQGIQTFLNTGEGPALNKRMEVSALKRGGTEFPVELTIAPITVDGKPAFSSFIRDISERKKAEIELIKHRQHLEEMVHERTKEIHTAREEAERANKSKSDFLSHMSHELRTPMNAILGFGQLLTLNDDGLNTIQKENVKEILDAGYHLLNLINEVLDLAKIESGKLEICIENVAIDSVIDESISLIKNQVKEKHLQLTDHISGHGHKVQADYNRLKQVLCNLFSNAIKYNRENGYIKLESQIIDKKRIRICMENSGEGLSNQDIEKLFTPFERLNAKNNIEGTGIGLVITKHLVELMDGTMGVISTPGKGCTFWFELELSRDA